MNFRSFLGVIAVTASAIAALSASGPSVAAPDVASTQKNSVALKGAASPWLEAANADAKSDSKKSDSKKSSAKKSAAKKSTATKPTAKKSAAKADASGDSKQAGKPVQVGSYGDWGAFLAQDSKDKTCYALATPKDREPAKLKRDPAYVFISNRPAEKVHNEVSIIMGFTIKESSDATAEIGGSNFDLIAKGNDAWIKNPAEETRFIEALKKGSKLIVKASSLKGNVTTDTYSLAGLSQALDRVQKDCP